MTQLTPDLLRSATGGVWIARMPEIELPAERPADMPRPAMHAPLTGVSTDTRSIRPGNVFVALRGERFDGHEFLLDAARAGATALVVDDEGSVPLEALRSVERGTTEGGVVTGPGVGVLRVADAGKALLAIAAAYRRTFTRTKVIAVCGSNGKTTTTRLIHAVLSAGLKGTHPRKSYNNSIGVPLTILSASPGDQYLICEVGTNAPGEIAALAQVVQPDIAVITSIGREHLEGLGDVAGVAREEGAILDALRPKGMAVVTADSPELTQVLKGKRVPSLVTFGRSEEATLRLTGTRTLRSGTGGGGGATFVTEFTVNDRGQFVLPMLGVHNALNALAAIAVARRMNVDEGSIAGALAAFVGPELRCQVHAIAVGGGSPVEILADCYNANPDSMLAALATLAAFPGPAAGVGRRVAVLGDMLELGAGASALHGEIAERLIAMDDDEGGRIDVAVLVGESMRSAADMLMAAGWGRDRVVHVAGVGDPNLADAVAALVLPGDAVLLKGSRRMALERVLEAIERRGQGGAGEPGGVAGAIGRVAPAARRPGAVPAALGPTSRAARA